ncbi:hypothetical protein IW261DRAFT_1131717 [Armillaria novae-zelandiae]|uniref:F-box domain-containing protein n=1 Tax=Armillaria novae-zelandiae TaxID=153914 RepID=A0AA39PC22_9AGAR|nr:hypothetical protein IW261DRAFT_1131717 [Armillaria novae-zelandiae]
MSATNYRCSNCVCSSCRPIESNAALSARNRMLLRSNAPPADEQIVHIQSARNRMSKRLYVLEEQIDAYVSTLFDLQKEKTKVETALQKYELILSAARRMPVELWYNIFQMCQSDAADFSSTSLSTTVVPWSLTQVCRRWKTIVNDMPQLWTDVRVNLDRIGGAGNASLNHAKYLLQQQLRRSEPLPISVSMDASTFAIFQLGTPLLSTIQSSSSRWRSLALYLPVPALNLFSAAGEVNPHRLEKLSIAITGLPTSVPPLLAWHPYAPNLTSISIGFFELHATWRLPWSQLRTFEINQVINTRFIARIFDLSPWLQTLTIWRWNHVIDPLIDCKHAQLTKVVLGEGNDNLDELLRALTLPALSEMELHYCTWSISALTAFLQRSKCQLYAITIFGGDPTSPIHLFPLYRFLTQLRHLTINLVVTDQSITRLTTDQFGLLLPHLDTICVNAKSPVLQKVHKLRLFVELFHSRGWLGDPGKASQSKMSKIEFRLSRSPDAHDESLETAHTLVSMLRPKAQVFLDRMIIMCPPSQS